MGVNVRQENGACQSEDQSEPPPPPCLSLAKTRVSPLQGSKKALVHLHLRVPQAVGQVKILIFLVKIKFFQLYANNFCDAGQVPIFKYFDACPPPPHLSLVKTRVSPDSPSSCKSVHLHIAPQSVTNKICCNYLRMSLRVRIIHVMP